MARCGAEGCKAKVEDGMVRCPTCGASLARPGAFLQTLGYVIIAVSAIPFAVAEVVSKQGNYLPLVLGGAILGVGVTMVVAARLKSRAAPPAVVEEEEAGEALL
jgi:hypothetical protein